MSAIKKAELRYISVISEAELSCRLYEALTAVKRPEGVTAEQAFQSLPDDIRAMLRRASVAAMDYWRECIQQANSVS